MRMLWKNQTAPALRLDVTAVTLGGPRGGNDDRYVMGTENDLRLAKAKSRMQVYGGVPFLAAVADGVSSTPDKGEIAQFAVEQLGKLFRQGADPRTWLQEVNRAASSLYLDPEKSIPTPSGATTLSLLAFTGTRVIAANVGDSPILRIRGEEMMPMFLPHSQYAQDPLQVGRDRRQDGGALTNFIGNPYYSKSKEFFMEELVQPGDTYVVCSDGAAQAVTWRRLLNCLQTRKKPTAAQLLHHYADPPRDDSTLILIRVLPAAGGLPGVLQRTRLPQKEWWLKRKS